VGINDQLRQEVIEQYGVLGVAPARELQALADLAAHVCGVPSSAINLITGIEQHQVAASGFDPSVCSRDDSMCAAVLDEPEPVVVPDASRDARFSQNPFVTGVIGDVRFYASAPLVTPEQLIVGRLCVFDTVERVLTPQQNKALEVLAQQVTEVLELRLRSRQLEESLGELTRTRDELRRSNEQLSIFAAQVSHDLLNPLTAILANSELIMSEPVIAADQPLLEMVEATFNAGKRMEAMMEEVLEYARIGGQLRITDTDLNQVLAAVLADLEPALGGSGAKVEAAPLPTVRGDARQIYAVLLNLLNNALKFSRPGVPPEVSLGADTSAGRSRIWIQDNGIGVPLQSRDHVFRPFVRANPAVPGTGIGLATSKRIIESHNGRIGIDGSPGGGTTVWFELPLAESMA
jgi:signal transduction histidine kinase